MGIAMGVVLQALAVWIEPEKLTMATIGVFIIVVGISYGFELFSKLTGKGHYEILDAIAAIIGGTLGMGLVLLIWFCYKLPS